MRQLKRTMPRPVRRAFRRAQRRLTLSRATRRILDRPAGTPPTRSDLGELHFGWGNTGYSADLAYLERIAAEAARVDRPILECGSGLTTLILGLVAGRRGIEVWTLEHHRQWQGRVERVLARYGLSVHVVHAPIVERGTYAWYDPPLDEMPPSFGLVVCDGPPGTTLGGRYGLIPVMRERLADGATILLDDAGREDEIAILERWALEAGVTYDFFGDSDDAARVMLPAHATVAETTRLGRNNS